MKRLSKKRDYLLFVLFVLLAALTWYIHAMGAPQTTQINVAVNWIGIPERIALHDSLPKEIVVTLRDRGQQLRQYRQHPITVTIDVSENMKDGILFVGEEMLHTKISQSLETSTQIHHLSPLSIQQSYYHQDQKDVPIQILGTYKAAEGYQLTSCQALGSGRVTLYGTPDQLDAVDTIFSIYKEYNDIHDTMQLAITLDIPNGLRANQHEVYLRTTAERYTEKTLIVPIRMTHVPQDCTMEIYQDNVYVTIHVGEQYYHDIQESDIVAECNYLHRGETRVPVECTYSHPHIFQIAKVKPEAIDYQITQSRNNE